jgi:DNA-binding winged helix-turn-helix (wHTH) protein
VDVHVRRLRAKLGTEHEALIGTVRNVGYRFVPFKGASDDQRTAQDAGDDEHDTGSDDDAGLSEASRVHEAQPGG